MEAEGLCETPSRPWAWSRGSLVCALSSGTAAGLAAPLRLHACVDWGKAGGAPRCASGNSFLPPQNKEELLIPGTGKVRGRQCFMTRGGCSCTNCLQAEAAPDSRCGFVPGASSKSCCVEGSPVGWGAAPCPLWHGCDWVLLSQTLSGVTFLGQGQPQLGPSLVAGLCCPASSFYPGFDVCHMGWSLFICLLGFPCCVPLRLVPMLRRSRSLALALLRFPPSFPVGPFSYQGCFLPSLCKITSLFPAAGLDLRCPAGSTLAANGG